MLCRASVQAAKRREAEDRGDKRIKVGVRGRGLIAHPNRTLLIAYPGGAASGSIGDWESAIMTGE